MLGHFDIRNMILMIVPVLLALTVHECAHAWAAYKLGDPTAKNAGRLTLNPLAHLDPVGTLVLFLSQMFGWAKPVPFDPRNFKNPLRDSTLVALAGPTSNMATAIVLAIVLKILLLVGFFKLIPAFVGKNLFDMFVLSILINVGIAIFNMLPLPPLDGFKVLSYFLPHRLIILSYQYQQYMFVAVIILVAFGVLQKIIGPIVFLFQSLIFGLIVG